MLFEGEEIVATRVPCSELARLTLAAITVLVVAGCQLPGGGSASEPTPTEKASLDDIEVSVGGVGRIVQSKAVTRAPDPTTTSGATSAPANAVYPTTSGNVLKYLVVPGQRVARGQPLLRLDDGGTAAAAAKQAGGDLAVARLELAQLLGSRPAEVGAAMLDVKRAQAELEIVRGGTPAGRARAIRAARRNVELARNGLRRILAPASSADVRAVEAEVRKAEAERAALKKPAPRPSTKAVVAAEQAVIAANYRFDKVVGPPDPVAAAVAQQEVAQAESNLTLLLAQREPSAAPPEIFAARAAVDAARAKRTQITGPPDAATVAAAVADQKKAEADLEALTKAPPRPSAEAVAAAETLVDAANLKLVKLKGAPNAADVRGARLELERAQAEERALRLGASPAARSAAEQAVRSSRAKLAQLSGSPIEVARLKIKAAEAKRNAARFALRPLTVRSPSDGTVTAVLSVPGAPVDRSTPIATVTDLDSLAASVDLSEFDVAQVKLGQTAVVSVDALGGKAFPGKVAFVALVGTETAGVVTFPVRVTLTRSGGLKPGMNVSVRIIVAQKGDVVQVPLEAVTRDQDDNAFVTVVDQSGQETKRPVKLGLANNESVEIVKGLREGESVVLAEPPATATEEP
jgi:RND family efflux transporter MFP subunit